MIWVAERASATGLFLTYCIAYMPISSAASTCPSSLLQNNLQAGSCLQWNRRQTAQYIRISLSLNILAFYRDFDDNILTFDLFSAPGLDTPYLNRNTEL